SCDLFLFALSPDSVRSRPCQAELAYAVALKRPILPVRVRDVNEQLAPDPIPITQISDYRQRTPQNVIDLSNAAARTAPPLALPDPLPAPPETPRAELGPLRTRVRAPNLGLAAQREVLDAIRRRGEDEPQLDAVVGLLRVLRARPDVAEAVARE